MKVRLHVVSSNAYAIFGDDVQHYLLSLACLNSLNPKIRI